MVETIARTGENLPPEIEVVEYAPHLLDAKTLKQIAAVYERSYGDSWLGKVREHFFEDTLANTTSIHLLKRADEVIGAINYNGNRIILLGVDPNYQGNHYGEILLGAAVKPDTWATIAIDPYAYPMLKLFTNPQFGFKTIDELEQIKNLFTKIQGTLPDDRFEGEMIEHAFLTRRLGKEYFLIFTHTKSVHGLNYRQIAVQRAA